MMDYVPHHMLVTGGAGFIGANFVHYALKNYPDLKILNLDCLTYAGSLDHLTEALASSRHTFVRGNILDIKLVASLLREHDIDTIVHFAAESHVDRSIEGPSDFVQTNLVGTYTLLEEARRFWLKEKKWDADHCRFHHISTDEVFGALGLKDMPLKEDAPYAPNSPYSATKAGSDHIVRAYFNTYGLPITISHSSNNYGPMQHIEKWVPTIIHGCLQQKPIPLYGDGNHVRDWLYVLDHCRGIFSIIHQGKLGESYNICGNYEINNRALAQEICAQMDLLIPKQSPYFDLVTSVSDRPGHDRRYAMTAEKIHQSLGWKAETPFQTGICETINYYQKILLK